MSRNIFSQDDLIIIDKVFNLPSFNVDKRKLRSKIKARRNQSFNDKVNEMLNDRFKRECEIYVKYTIQYNKGDKNGEEEERMKNIIQHVPRYLNRREWYLYILTQICDDLHDYYFVVRIDEAKIKFIDKIDRTYI